MKSELEDFISNNRESFDNRLPNPEVLKRIQAQLQQKQQTAPAEPVTPKERALVIPMRMLRWAVAACFVLIAGGAAFWALQKDDASIQSTTAKIEPPVVTQPAAAPSTETKTETVITEGVKENLVQSVAVKNNSSAIEEENRLHKQLLFARLNNMESPSQRVAAATQVYQMKSTDTDIVDALAKTMNTDPSTNVRLAALDALGKFYREPYVKKKLLASLDQQKDPMVQIGLIELLTKMKQRSILKELDRIVNDGNSMQAVKDQAYESIFKLDHKNL